MDASDQPAKENFATKSRTPDQVSLFSTEDLIIPESVLSLKKAVSAIHTYPAKSDKNHTLNTQRLFDACILVAQMDIRKRRDVTIEQIRLDRVSPVFEARITDLAKLAGIVGKNYRRLYEDLDRLYEMPLHWNIIGEDKQVMWKMKAHFFSLLGIGEGNKNGLVRFAMDPEILAIILEPTNWANLSMQVLRTLKNKASHSLYQNVFRYLGTAQKVTAQLPLETWINLIAGPSRYVKTDEATGDTTVNYKDFKRFILVPAIEQINAHPALTYKIHLLERYSGKRVAALQFSFELKQQASLDLPVSWSDDTIKVLRTLGFTDSEISNMSQAHSQVEIVEALTRLPASEAVLRARGRAITDKKAYFSGILEKVHMSWSAETDAQEVSMEVEKKIAQDAALARKERLQVDFMGHQRARATANFFALDEVDRVSRQEAFESSPKGLESSTAFLVARGWRPDNVALMALFLAWAKDAAPDLMERLLPYPEDQDFEAWRNWKLVGN
jgi:plasmid replication initiation protein